MERRGEQWATAENVLPVSGLAYSLRLFPRTEAVACGLVIFECSAWQGGREVTAPVTGLISVDRWRTGSPLIVINESRPHA